jgi:hypothetical protein
MAAPAVPQRRGGSYENGVFKHVRHWNGGQTDWGLNFGDLPVVLRVSLAVYEWLIPLWGRSH